MKFKCISKYSIASVLLCSSFLALGTAEAQTAGFPQAAFPQDPGVRDGTAGAGGPLPGLSANQVASFNYGLAKFATAEQLSNGLGPRFNLDSCSGCHLQPSVGGTGPATNPQVALATAFGANNTVPSFISATGPVREARFVKNADGSPDGGVHALFVISGRNDGSANAIGCHITQDDFEAQVNHNNVVFRIPTPVFGIGLVEMIDDTTLRSNIAANNAAKKSLGIFGRFNISGAANTNGNDGTITRFGWKAQNKSGLLFAAEAYNVEMGISNEIFQSEREENADCQFAGVANDVQNMDAATPLDATADIQNFANFMRFSAPPTPVASYGNVSADSITRGKQRFTDIGCQLCHTPTLTTNPKTSIAALANKPVNAFSDFAIHGMGPGLADGVSQGGAAGDNFRSAPLWGLGQRIFLLHDGRTKDLVTAIRAHRSYGNTTYGPSEANHVINNFDLLYFASFQDTQDLLNFLRSL